MEGHYSLYQVEYGAVHELSVDMQVVGQLYTGNRFYLDIIMSIYS